MTRPLVATAARRLAAAGVPSPDHDAAELLAHVLGTSRAGLVTVARVSDGHRAAYAALVARREAREPLQHLTGVAGFRYLELAVGPGVFTPRPETELLAGWGVDRLRGVDHPVVVDLCCGSGAIALAVAQEVPAATVYAVELDPPAVLWARRNAVARAAAGDRPVRVLAGDATDPAVLSELDGTVDLVLTNPPYIPDGAEVDPEVRRHDPALALWGGPDGFDVVRGLLARAAALLRPGGWLGLEHADRQGESLPAVVTAHGGFRDVQDHPDLLHRPRYTTARKG